MGCECMWEREGERQRDRERGRDKEKQREKETKVDKEREGEKPERDREGETQTETERQREGRERACKVDCGPDPISAHTLRDSHAQRQLSLPVWLAFPITSCESRWMGKGDSHIIAPTGSNFRTEPDPYVWTSDPPSAGAPSLARPHTVLGGPNPSLSRQTKGCRSRSGLRHFLPTTSLCR